MSAVAQPVRAPAFRLGAPVESRSPIVDSGDFRPVSFDLVQKTVRGGASGKRDNTESVRVLVDDIECLAANRTGGPEDRDSDSSVISGGSSH